MVSYPTYHQCGQYLWSGPISYRSSSIDFHLQSDAKLVVDDVVVC